jgi:hypothetical protein
MKRREPSPFAKALAWLLYAGVPLGALWWLAHQLPFWWFLIAVGAGRLVFHGLVKGFAAAVRREHENDPVHQLAVAIVLSAMRSGSPPSAPYVPGRVERTDR